MPPVKHAHKIHCCLVSKVSFTVNPDGLPHGNTIRVRMQFTDSLRDGTVERVRTFTPVNVMLQNFNLH
jgi:hypothetical protein